MKNWPRGGTYEPVSFAWRDSIAWGSPVSTRPTEVTHTKARLYDKRYRIPLVIAKATFDCSIYLSFYFRFPVVLGIVRPLVVGYISIYGGSVPKGLALPSSRFFPSGAHRDNFQPIGRTLYCTAHRNSRYGGFWLDCHDVVQKKP